MSASALRNTVTPGTAPIRARPGAQSARATIPDTRPASRRAACRPISAFFQRKWAEDFLLYCQRNPQPCPLIARSDVGDPRLPTLADDLDIRTDIPRYHIFRDGDIRRGSHRHHGLWRDDLVTFALGCSFSFEEALQQAGAAPAFP